jgi:hypothetical protein
MKLTMPWTATEADHNGMTRTIDDVRQALGKEVDHLAQVAAQLGHETTDKAAVTARDTTKDARAAMRQLFGGAAALGPAIALMGRRRMKDVSRDARSLSHELRQVRLTTEPRRNSPDLTPGIALLGGFGAGLALMYFFDPERGHRRRLRLQAQLTRWTRVGRETAALKATEFRNRTVGVMAEARKAVGASESSYESVQRDTEAWMPEGERIPVG